MTISEMKISSRVSISFWAYTKYCKISRCPLVGAGKLIGVVGRMFVGQAQSRKDDFTKENAENVREYSLQAAVVPYPVWTFDGLGRRSRF